MAPARKKGASPARRAPRYGGEFTSELFTYPGKGGWTFTAVPERFAPPVTEGWGRTPVEATVDGTTWSTSVWREKSGRTLLPVPKHVRGAKGHGDRVRVRIKFSAL
jgi:hypothetical protein